MHILWLAIYLGEKLNIYIKHTPHVMTINQNLSYVEQLKKHYHMIT